MMRAKFEATSKSKELTEVTLLVYFIICLSNMVFLSELVQKLHVSLY